MTITQLQEILRDTVKKTARDSYGVELAQMPSEIPPKTELGDLAFPVAFELAKLIKQATGEKANPRQIGETLKLSLETIDFVERVEVAGPGYLNVFFDRPNFIRENADADPLPALTSPIAETDQKICVEHTSVNPNKAAHIGHVRNAVLGDTFQRILKATGKTVEVQYYIDNTGVQVADVVVGFVYLEDRDLEGIKRLDEELAAEGRKFDFYCWDLYAKVGQVYQTDDELKSKRGDVLHLIEAGNNPIAEIGDFVSTRNVHCIVETMQRFSIRYDLLPRESEILHLHFWRKAFDRMKELGAIYFEEEGKNAGCWVMPFESHAGTDDHDADKILVRSNGTVTYTGKDIAYQMWKLGLLGMDFFYKPFHRYADGKQIWTTSTSRDDDVAERPKFGNGTAVYNVIDSRQSYTQDVVKKGVALLAPDKGEAASVHLSYEMVALSPAAAEELGFALSEEDRSRTFVEMSGRKGLGVKADDLLDRLEEKALAEVETRHADISGEEKLAIARQIAVGALRYFLLKFTRNTVIVFDFKEALSFDGETGAFCQYSAVRANSIFRKLQESGESIEQARDLLSHDSLAEVFAGDGGDEIWAMLLTASRLEDAVNQAASQTEPATLAKYTYNLAKSFNLFYHRHKILPEPDKVKRAVLLCVADRVRRSLTAALSTMGIDVPPRM
jgi:arginyl-tRNA synthetase